MFTMDDWNAKMMGASDYYKDPPMPPPTDIHATLIERGARYGDWSEHARIREEFFFLMGQGSWAQMAPFQRQALLTIADKIARILNGDPNYDDNWRDIAGYATLVLERLPKAPTS